jgi:hypothetical protein
VVGGEIKIVQIVARAALVIYVLVPSVGDPETGRRWLKSPSAGGCASAHGEGPSQEALARPAISTGIGGIESFTGGTGPRRLHGRTRTSPPPCGSRAAGPPPWREPARLLGARQLRDGIEQISAGSFQ